MNIQQNEEADLKLIGVENSDYGRSDTNPPECVRLKEINGFKLFKIRARFCNKEQLSYYQNIK